jgi:hypothetical protein
VKRVLCALAIAMATGCISEEPAPTSFAAFAAAPTVHFSRATTGLTSYGGTGFYQWNIVLTTTDGCGGDTVATFEINTALTAPNAFPTGVIPIRAEQVPAAVPSALATMAGGTGVSGSLTITAADTTRVDGSAYVTLTTGPVTGTFIAYTCP